MTRSDHEPPSEAEFKAKVLRGIAQAERGEVIPHSQVKRELGQRIRCIAHKNGDGSRPPASGT